jgi:hypothetical protein
LLLAERQDVAARGARVERGAPAVLESVEVGRRAVVVAVLAELRDRGPVEVIAAPVADVEEKVVQYVPPVCVK